MATIEKRGETCRITVSIGYDVNGKQIRKRMTYKPPENLTPSQLKKDLQKKALDFEEKCQSGLYLDGSIKLADYIPMFYKDYCKNNVRESTLIGYKASTISSWYYSFIRENGFKESHLHSLRHTNATLLIASGVNVRTIASRLGHSQVSTTTNLYSHPLRTADERAADALGDILNPSSYKSNK